MRAQMPQVCCNRQLLIFFCFFFSLSLLLRVSVPFRYVQQSARFPLPPVSEHENRMTAMESCPLYRVLKISHLPLCETEHLAHVME